MLQRKSRFLPALVCALLLGCDGRATPTKADGIVSLSPAATDLILAMGAGDQLVGVSTYDSDPRVAGLPRVGDYLNADWERIAVLKPKHLVAQMAADRVPAGFGDRIEKLGISLHRVQIDRFDDIPREASQIGAAIGQPEAGERFAKQLREPIEALRTKLANRPRVRTLIALSEDGLTVAGPGTFLDDALIAAGGVNALGPARSGYSQIDRELVLSLAPDAVIQLAPSATPAQLEANDRVWASLPTVPAVANKRVLTIVQPWAMLPGSHVVDLAQRMADHLHPEAH